ncbi:MAG: hypothetical protein ABW352_12585 [Polyangiales bacterium]
MTSWCKLLCVWIMLAASSASAQDLPAWMKVRASYLASSSEQVELDTSVASPRRGPAFMAAAGTGVVLGAAVYTAVFGVKGSWCSESDQRVKASLPVGFAVMGVGAALAVAGALRVVRAPREPGVRRSDQALFALTALGAMAGGFLVPTLASIPNLGCYQS